jgi:polysaccharide biosynthesis protein PslH
MNILHISNKPVFPLVDGGCVAMSKILESLQQLADTEHIFIQTSKHPFVAGAYPENVALPFPAEKTLIDTNLRPGKALKALFSDKNYNLSRFYNRDFEKLLTDYVTIRSFDVIVLESLFLAMYIPSLRKVTKAKLIVRAHNVEHELWEQQALHASFPKNLYLRSLAKSLKREEIQLLNEADHIWAITDEDHRRFKTLGIQTPITTIPVAMEIPEVSADYSCNDFFHLGSLNWLPNRMAVKELTEQIWPKSNLTNSRLHIAGSFSDKQNFHAKNIRFHGHVKDAVHFMQTHGILVSPVRTGSGVRIKLLEALSLGVPCITTSLGATGIRQPEEILCVANTEAEWLKAIKKMCDSETLRHEFGLKAQRYMQKYHSFATVNAQILKSLEY